jgi:hypothetical protein
MKETIIGLVHVIPLYRVLHEPLSLCEVHCVIGPTLDKRQKVIEIQFTVEGLGPAAAVGIYQGSTKIPMQHLFTRCDYHQPPGHFIAIEDAEIARMSAVFPKRFVRVWGVCETPYQ